MSESDFYWRQILTTKVDPRTVRVELAINYEAGVKKLNCSRH